MDIDKLRREISDLKDRIQEAERALPAHSIRPHQMMELEDLEEQLKVKLELLEQASKS